MKELNITQVNTQTMRERYKIVFDKLKSVFLGLQKPQSEQMSAWTLQVELRPDTLYSPFLELLTNHIQLMSGIVQKVQVTTLQEKIPNEYVGRASYWDRKKLVYQVYLSIQEVIVCKKRVENLRTFPLVPKASLGVVDNIFHP